LTERKLGGGSGQDWLNDDNLKEKEKEKENGERDVPLMMLWDLSGLDTTGIFESL